MNKLISELQLIKFQIGLEKIDSFQPGDSMGEIQPNDKIVLDHDIQTLVSIAKGINPEIEVVPYFEDNTTNVTHIRVVSSDAVVIIEKEGETYRLIKYLRSSGKDHEKVKVVTHVLLFDPNGNSTLCNATENDIFNNIEVPCNIARTLLDSFYMYGNSTEVSEGLVSATDKCLAILDSTIDKAKATSPSIQDGIIGLKRSESPIFGIYPNFYFDANPPNLNIRLKTAKTLGQNLFIFDFDQANPQVHLDWSQEKEQFALTITSNGRSIIIFTDKYGGILYAMQAIDKLENLAKINERTQSYQLLFRTETPSEVPYFTTINCSRKYCLGKKPTDWTTNVTFSETEPQNASLYIPGKLAPDYFRVL